jgi:hypothetical protein
MSLKLIEKQKQSCLFSQNIANKLHFDSYLISSFTTTIQNVTVNFTTTLILFHSEFFFVFSFIRVCLIRWKKKWKETKLQKLMNEFRRTLIQIHLSIFAIFFLFSFFLSYQTDKIQNRVGPCWEHCGTFVLHFVGSIRAHKIKTI